MINILPGAQFDLIEGAARYGRIGGKDLARKFIEAIDNKLQQILLFPEAYPVRINNKYRIAVLSNFPYTIYYSNKNSEIYVSAILFNDLPPKVILEKLQ